MLKKLAQALRRIFTAKPCPNCKGDKLCDDHAYWWTIR
jgi:hypothetical protein